MSHKIHSQARTTPKIRAEIQACTLSDRAAAKKYNVTRSTIRKWRKRENQQDLSHCPYVLKTTLTPIQELIVVELRKTLLLPLDDLLVITREFVNPKVSRAGLQRCLKRNGVSRIADIVAQQRFESGELPEEKPKKTFKDYQPGFIHIDIKYLPKMPDEEERSYLFVAIDRATRWVFLAIYPDQTQESSVDFLDKVVKNCPVKIEKVLTDNGTQFTDRFTSKENQPTGNHAFDKACTAHKVEHRLIPPRHPQTNGMVERFNGRISELVKQTRFASADELKSTLLNYVLIYNHHIPQRALHHLTPYQTLQIWREKQPQIFTESVYNHTKPDRSFLVMGYLNSNNDILQNSPHF
jgi:transposase-like protein